MVKRVVLAYSGGLDTSVAVRWMVEEQGVEVIALAADVGQGGDLEELGAVKARLSGGDLVYVIPEQARDRPAPEDHLKRVMGDWVVEVSHSLNLVVLRTPPGSAHVVGSALDRAGLAEILGTVAGDDTVFVVADERTGGRRLAERIRRQADERGAS